MKITIDEVNEIDYCRKDKTEWEIQFTDFDENYIEIGFTKDDLIKLQNKINEMLKK